MSLYQTELVTLDGEKTTLAQYQGKVLLVVNVASKCGLTPQYEQLESLQKAWQDKDFSVLGFPPAISFSSRNRAATKRSKHSAARLTA
ncbi:hypothetical protein E05_12400 [Plautia stali symbiont]|nr:hypothetical protein E05_12400 [Plautia stali symbiont]